MSIIEFDIIKDELKELESFIYKNVKSSQALIASAVDELVTAGGKRIRPALTILVGKSMGAPVKKLIPVAASMEIIHMATLVHDDIVDDSGLRRGMPTVQSKYGKDVAVFTGDYLFSQAFSVIAHNASKESLTGFAYAIKRICEGEIEQYESRYSLDMSLLKYLRRIRRKTGELIALSCIAGLIGRKVTKSMVRNLASYGMYFGLAFQITDDILDFTGNVKAVGKPVGNDFKHGIYTLPLIYAIEHSKRKDELLEYLSKENYNQEDVSAIVDIVNKSGGIEFSKNLAERYIAKGIKSLDVLKNNDYKEALIYLINKIGVRKY